MSRCIKLFQGILVASAARRVNVLSFYTVFNGREAFRHVIAMAVGASSGFNTVDLNVGVNTCLISLYKIYESFLIFWMEDRGIHMAIHTLL